MAKYFGSSRELEDVPSLYLPSVYLCRIDKPLWIVPTRCINELLVRTNKNGICPESLKSIERGKWCRNIEETLNSAAICLTPSSTADRSLGSLDVQSWALFLILAYYYRVMYDDILPLNLLSLPSSPISSQHLKVYLIMFSYKVANALSLQLISLLYRIVSYEWVFWHLTLHRLI